MGETRKHKRAAERQAESKAQKEPASLKPAKIESPVEPGQLKGMFARLAIPVAGAWVLGGSIAAFTQTPSLRIVMISVPMIVTLLALAVVIWVTRQASKARGVAGILSGVESAEDRKAALAQLDASYKKNDPTAAFAKAQL